MVVKVNCDASNIKVGDIFWKSEPANASGWHVGLVTAVTGTKIKTIEGNLTNDIVGTRSKEICPGGKESIVYVARPITCK